ncbi:bifunctional hydroxymethylpyrimidine kinase/phosphomethylpyrimidine kinase [Altererythrobacter endophyticus]|uniref:hydroxymethylpyrimidine kinase n=1 Tax=Altericroceibacterium endophyticum TaxID=1808508 RepID=A0A6I4T4I1_9SPHN|nr:bifunctional hydroxymethylpyrimidine kinase/phosphomethylpyrimidine kinase [Altericroceibacterium endophyticum]
MPVPPRILAIAGSDSSGGAGIQADIKTITMLGGYAMTAITAVTAQNTLGVKQVETLSPSMLAAQIECCVSDIGVDAVKIGMLGSPQIAEIAASHLRDIDAAVVFDPVMVATSGAVLADEDTIAAFRLLMDRATLVTPNLPELEALTGLPCTTQDEIYQAAATLVERHSCHVLAKGGHSRTERVLDLLVRSDGSAVAFDHARIETRHTHGTGCTLSSAIATLLGHGQGIDHAVRLARKFVFGALQAAPGFGSGHGPMGHQALRGRAQSSS